MVTAQPRKSSNAVSAEYYDSIAHGYDELHGEEQKNKIKIIKQHLKTSKKDRLLDVGCGTGLSSDFDCEAYGIDPSAKLLEQSKLPKSRKKVAGAEKIPFPDNHFDIVICVSAVHNFDDIQKGLSEIKRVGRDRFAITVLKRSPKKDMIVKMIRKMFKVKEMIEEKQDMIFILGRADAK